MIAIVSLASAAVSLAVGFSVGYLVKQDKFSDEVYDLGFTHGYELAKDNFYNPDAKG